MKRREFLKLSAGALVVVAGAGLGPLLRRNRRIYRKTMPLMGTIGDIQVVHDDADLAYRAMDRAFEELIALETRLSFFREDSDIGRINASVRGRPVMVSLETAHLLQQALEWSEVTDGFFEPGLGRVTEVWDVKHRTAPPAEALWRRYAGREFHRHIRLVKGVNTATIQLFSDDIKIDLGGIAKGYAADRARRILSEAGIDQGMVNLGGDVAALGSKDSQAWKVGIRNPEQPSTIERVLELNNESVATSGTYEQYFISDGRMYHHLIDPFAARPGREGFRSLTVVTASCRDADALATGLFFMDDKKTQYILDANLEQARWIRLGV